MRHDFEAIAGTRWAQHAWIGAAVLQSLTTYSTEPCAFYWEQRGKVGAALVSA